MLLINNDKTEKNIFRIFIFEEKNEVNYRWTYLFIFRWKNGWQKKRWKNELYH